MGDQVIAVEVETLVALVLGWEHSARRMFIDAEVYVRDSMERRFLEHAAICYSNCALALRAVIPDGLCPPASATPAAA